MTTSGKLYARWAPIEWNLQGPSCPAGCPIAPNQIFGDKSPRIVGFQVYSDGYGGLLSLLHRLDFPAEPQVY